MDSSKLPLRIALTKMKNRIRILLSNTIICIFAILLVGCNNSYTPKEGNYIEASTPVTDDGSTFNEDGTQVLNPEYGLSVPTWITKYGDYYFIVDCYHNRVIYSKSLESPLNEWRVMTDDINMGHTVASDGQVYLVDDTENNRVLIFEEDTDPNGETVFKNTQEFTGIGTRPHYIIYDEETDTVYVWSSMTGEMYLFRRDKDSKQVYLTEKLEVPELNGFYVRSFTIMDDKIYFVSGNLNIIEASLKDFSIINRYPVPNEIAGMVQLTKIEDYYYITVSTDANASQDAATLIRTKSLESLATGDYEDVYDNFIGGGTPYAITKIDDHYYLCEHRLPGHSIWQFDVKDNEIINQVSLY